jgi:hypothetical protein
MAQQPEPKMSFDGARRVLPTMNGLSGRHLATLFDGLEVIRLERRPLYWWRPRWLPFTSALLRAGLPSPLDDAVTGGVTAILRKPVPAAA